MIKWLFKNKIIVHIQITVTLNAKKKKKKKKEREKQLSEGKFTEYIFFITQYLFWKMENCFQTVYKQPRGFVSVLVMGIDAILQVLFPIA